jgi:phosphate transport system substrate-binding protein
MAKNGKRLATGLVGIAAIGAVLAACSSSGSSSSTSSISTGCQKGSISADGSSAQANAQVTWTGNYNKGCSGATVNYTATSSGQGIADFTAGKIAFAGSDSALDPAKGEPEAASKACGSTALDIPMVTGPIAIAYNVSGLTNLTLTPVLITNIFLGKITTWNDPAIAAANSGATLPSTKISVFFRSDESGTTQNFERYLAATNPTGFTYTPSKSWPGTVGSGVAGSSAVADGVKNTDGGIGYMEWSYAGNKGLSVAKVDNGGGAVTLNGDTASAAVAAAQVVGTGDDLTLKLDYTTKAPGAYPIILVTYEIVCTKYKSSSTGALVKSYLSYTASKDGQGLLAAQGYAPLPSEILTKVQASIGKIS